MSCFNCSYFLHRAALLAITTLSILPIRLRQILGFTLGYAVGLVPSRERKIASLQLQAIYGTEGSYRQVAGIFAQKGVTLLEFINLKPLLSSKYSKIRCEDWELINRVVGRSKGVIALSAHLANWDLLAAYMVSKGIDLSVAGKPLNNKFLQSILLNTRKKYGVHTIWRLNSSGVREILKQLKNGSVIAALIDQDTRVSSEIVPFFGRPAKTPSALVEVAKRSGATLVSAFIVREIDGGYRIYVEELSTDASTLQILMEYNRRLEALINDYPSQWVWFHKRWRTPTKAKTLSSQEYLELLQQPEL